MTLSLCECKKYAEYKSGKCLSTIYKTCQHKMKWKCSEGHIWSTTFSIIKQGGWCKICAHNDIRIGLTKCKELAKNKNGKCLSKQYINNCTKMIWRCHNGHTWKASYANIKNRTWCPYCAKQIKHTIEECKTFAKNKGGKCISNTYINSSTKIEWECNNGHRWKSNFKNVFNLKKWCPNCANNVKFDISDCKKYAENKNGKCLSLNYANNREKLEWECALKHKWLACFGSIKGGTWCPQCKLKHQNILFEILKNIFPDTLILYNFKDFSWLKLDNGYRQELDIYIPDIKLAIEYDGEQHFMPRNFGGISDEIAEKNFIRQKELDSIKSKKAAEHTEDIVCFIRIPYYEEITCENIISILYENGIDIPILLV